MARQRAAAMVKAAKDIAKGKLAQESEDSQTLARAREVAAKGSVGDEDLGAVDRTEIPKGMDVYRVRFRGSVQVCGIPKQDLDAARGGVTMTLVGPLLWVEKISKLGPAVNGRQKMRREVDVVPIFNIEIVKFPLETYFETERE